MNWLAGALVALLVVGGFSSPAMAAGGKVTVFPADSNGQEHGGIPVLPSGDTFAFQLGYGSMDDGAVSTITLPEGVKIPREALVVPAGNTAVKSLEINEAGQLVVTFVPKFPGDVNQGVLDLKFTLEKVEHSDVRELNWDVDGVPTSQQIIVTKPGDKPSATTDGADKSVNRPNIPHTVVGGKVDIDKAVLGTKIPYTLTVKSKEARDVVVTDTLGKHLAFVEGSLKGKKVVRDSNDLNPEATDVEISTNISGGSFEHAFTAEANSVYTFTYEATIADAAALAAIRDELQVAYDKVAGTENGGDYSVKLTNGADVSGTKVNAAISIGGTAAAEDRPGVDKAFAKSVEPRDVALEKHLKGGEALAEPIDLTYTLTADLTKFADFANNEKYKLKNNVVIKDVLPDEVAWDISAKGTFLSLTDAAGGVIALTPIETLKGDVEKQIASDDYKFHYVVDGQQLFVNVGKDVKEKYTLTVKATLLELPAEAFDTGGLYIDRFLARNTANFVYGDNKYHGTHADTVVTTPKDLSGGVDDRDKFNKTATGGTLTAVEGTSVEVPYRFKVGDGLGNALTSRIIDAVDHEIFNVTEETLPQIKASISGKYDWNFPLDGDTFDVTLDKDGNLVIAPNAAFPKEASWGAAAAPMNKAWEIEFKLPTHVLKGKQTIDIKNSASYEGSDLEYTFTSSSQTKATSFGNEMEVQKRVYDAKNDAFTTNLRAATDADGKLLNDTFVYRVELMPHGTFSNMVEPVTDVLPDGVEFIGFVAPEDVKGERVDSNLSYQVPGSKLTANFDAAANTVTLEKGKLESGKTVSLFFKVKLVDAKENIGVTNIIGTSGATITPTNDYPLSLLKRDSADATKLITDSGARFSVLTEDKQTAVLEDLQIKDGKIVTASGGTPVVKQPGKYWLREDTAPAGYKKSDELLEIGFKADDSAKEVVFYNDRQNFAIGDYTWIDANRDGIQGADEAVLPGVKVELIRDGKVVAETTSDANGRYMFDELPSGEYQVKFTLTEEQQKIYTFTTQTAGNDGAVDSNADRKTGLSAKFVLDGSNKNLTKDYEFGKVKATDGIDPTWDAGVVLKTYAIGDYTWIDTNRDGVQNEDEEILAGVTVELLQGGKTIATTTTDENGRYLFDNLEAGEYEVKFTLTEEQQRVYQFTDQGKGESAAADSDANPETGLTTTIVLGDSNKNLTREYTDATVQATEGIDPTWDAGVVMKSVSVGDYVWLDYDRDGVQGTDENENPIPGVKLVLTGPDGKPVTDVFGKVVEPAVTNDDGFYEFTDLPVLKAGETYTVSIDREDSGTQEALAGLVPTKTGGTDDRELDSSEWTAESRDDLVNNGDRDYSLDFGFHSKSVSVGDYVWLDTDRDGVQGTSPDEKPIPGVKLVLTGPDGKPVTDVFGKVVEPAVTNDDGFYEFTDLPVLKAGETYTVSIDREDSGTQEALAGLVPTKTGGTDDRELDSSEWTAESRDDLVNNGDRDYSLDFGFQYKSYAIGDVVWIDANKDGVQDNSEKVLPGVTVELFQDGKVVKTTTTDANGRYIFDQLAAGEYEVKFTLTKEQQKVYAFTKQHAGNSDAADSNADPKTGFTVKIVLGDDNANLTLDYEFGTVLATQGIDPTWDAGVIVLDQAVPNVTDPEVTDPKVTGPNPANPGTPGVNELPATGGSLPLVVGGIALALLVAGASLMLWRRRTA